MAILFSIVESAGHPDFSGLYSRFGIEELKIKSVRDAMRALKKNRPDYIVAEFFYGYGNNYAGVNISNLDVLLSSLQKYAPECKVVVMVEKSERKYVDKLNDLFPLSAVFQHPVTEKDIEALLKE